MGHAAARKSGEPAGNTGGAAGFRQATRGGAESAGHSGREIWLRDECEGLSRVDPEDTRDSGRRRELLDDPGRAYGDESCWMVGRQHYLRHGRRATATTESRYAD